MRWPLGAPMAWCEAARSVAPKSPREAFAEMRQVGIGVDENLPAHRLPQPAEAVVLGEIAARSGVDHHVEEPVMHPAFGIRARRPVRRVAPLRITRDQPVEHRALDAHEAGRHRLNWSLPTM